MGAPESVEGKMGEGREGAVAVKAVAAVGRSPTTGGFTFLAGPSPFFFPWPFPPAKGAPPKVEGEEVIAAAESLSVPVGTATAEIGGGVGFVEGMGVDSRNDQGGFTHSYTLHSEGGMGTGTRKRNKEGKAGREKRPPLLPDWMRERREPTKGNTKNPKGTQSPAQDGGIDSSGCTGEEKS